MTVAVKKISPHPYVTKKRASAVAEASSGAPEYPYGLLSNGTSRGIYRVRSFVMVLVKV